MFVFFAALTRAWFVASNFHHTANHRLAYGVLVSTGECGTHVSFAPRRAIFTILKPIVSSIVWDPKGLLWCASQQFNQDN